MKLSLKILLVLLLALTAFHSSGAEMGFCDDSIAAQASESHGCMACQPSHHSATVQESEMPYGQFLETFFSFDDIAFQPQDPASFILRPPISL